MQTQKSVFSRLGISESALRRSTPAQEGAGLDEDIVQQILLNAEPAQVMTGLVKQLDGFANYGLAIRLTQLLRDPVALKDVASRSYRHGNGFYKIVLSASDLYKLRLHIWFAEADAEENIHDHRWWFASRILHGELISETYEDSLSTSDPQFPEYFYRGKQEARAASAELIGISRLRLTGRSVRRAGEGYFLPPGVLHRITGIGHGPMTATLMCQSNPCRAWNRLLTSKDITPDVEQRYLTRSELKEVLKRYLLLAGQACSTFPV
ncbi:MAG: hypothetical protein HZB71_11255 [Betaproteobacteria bacterium]|nr:hypothetical protein [Betaproteobacteria bacterium]